jgi:hypothetical protein
VKPVVEVSSPLVEAVLLKHPATGKRAVVLMNWGYRAVGKRTELVPARDLKVSLPGGETLTIPLLEEAEVLRLD